jgi:hypothetical protein
MEESMQSQRTRRRRPLGVVILVVIQVIYGAFAILELALPDADVDLRFLSGSFAPAIPAFSLLLAFGLWRLHRWAWTVMMLWTGLGLTADLVDYLHGDPNYLLMLESVIVVFYLNQREVQEAFGQRPSRAPVETAA